MLTLPQREVISGGLALFSNQILNRVFGSCCRVADRVEVSGGMLPLGSVHFQNLGDTILSILIELLYYCGSRKLTIFSAGALF